MVKHFVFFWSLLTLAACGGGGGSNSSTSTAPDTSSNDVSSSSSFISAKSSSSSSSIVASTEAIDCSHLDPKKVYLLGTLQEGTGGLEALADPSDPTKFCVGFEPYSQAGVISSKGEYIYVKDNSTQEFYRFAPESMVQDINGLWEYPKNVLTNDTLLFSSDISGCGVGTTLLQPITGEIYYSCPNNLIHSQTIRSYYFINGDKVLGIMPDGSLLLPDVHGLRLVSKKFEETSLDLPVGYDAFGLNWTRARLFKDPISGHDSVWIVGLDTVSARRFTLDLTTLKLTFDGEFTTGSSGLSWSSVLDGEGSLWQINVGVDGTFNDIITKRFLKSSGKQTTVIYNEADDVDDGIYQSKKKLFVRIHISSLVTGQ